MSFALSAVAEAKDKTIAVSWKTFQEERWKTDEAAIKAVVEAAGDKYISTDAQGSAQKQAADIEDRPEPAGIDSLDDSDDFIGSAHKILVVLQRDEL